MDAEPVVEEKEEWWSAREVTRFLSLSAREIEKLRRSGTLSATKRWPFGWRYSSQSVMGYFESLAVEAPPLLVQEPVSVEESARIRMQGIFELMKELEIEKSAEQEEPYSDYESAPPLIRVVNAVFANAIDGKASDVYFEAGLRSMRVRFRIGGVLQEVMPIPKLMQDQVTRRVMVMADIDLARLFVPQVGTINLRHNNRDWVVRVTAIPSIYGHTVTARFIDADLPRKGFRELGMLAEHFVPLENALEQEGGLFIFAGASASGTTTTVAACLHHLNKSQRAIYTIEQPVEYELPGITQIQLNPFCGHTLDKALKTVLRARPDVLFLGSIHDTESARAAMDATEAGITVLTTMRCTNIPTVFTLLERYGIPPQTQARLIQVILNQCLLFPPETETATAFFEAAWVADNTSLRELVAKRATQQEIQHILRYWSKGTTLEEQLKK